MAVTFYMDVHVPLAITEQLRRRGINVLTAIEDGCAELPDEELLQRANELGRILHLRVKSENRAMAQSRSFSRRLHWRKVRGRPLDCPK